MNWVRNDWRWWGVKQRTVPHCHLGQQGGEGCPPRDSSSNRGGKKQSPALASASFFWKALGFHDLGGLAEWRQQQEAQSAGNSPGAQSRGSVPGGWCVGGVGAGPWRRSQPWLGGRSKSSSDRACSGQEAGAPVHWSVMIWLCTVGGRRVCAKDNMSGALLHTPLRFLETLLECCEFIRTRWRRYRNDVPKIGLHFFKNHVHFAAS